MPEMLEVLAEAGIRPPVGKSSEEFCREVVAEIRQNWGLEAELLKLVREVTGCEYADFSGLAAVRHALTRISVANRELRAQVEPLKAELSPYRAIAALVPQRFRSPAEPDSPGAKSLEAMVRHWNELLLRCLGAPLTDAEVRQALGLEAVA